MSDPNTVPPDQLLVLRSQLPLPNPYVAPRTATEQRLAEIWRSVLTMDRIGIEDAYVDLGGDSFLATVIFEMIQDSFGTVVPMATLATAPTIAALARKIDDLLAAKA
jgi:acyl carrier protein